MMKYIKNRSFFHKGFTLIELLVVIALIGILASVILVALNTARTKGQDANRVSEVRQIQYALALYYDTNGNYPTCLYPGGSCTTTLQSSTFMKTVPKDPLTAIGYSYAANGAGANCSSYHLGVSLADKKNPALRSGADAPPVAVCTGSAADFSGLAYTAAGVACDTTAGTAQPTNAADGETCFDIKP
jgi:prepilin-type N-terminal cleavage/methylation domain-containing protein